ncbi:STAS domain-containing protein [Lentzea jiangxiensis]|uniref:Anti-anti-sigma factor n=1 Tax=Lentzea jiangxiensis TaxID=641025 RepID=A0A1H0WS64_9PSEU|nr:STAS domain-containing protein [Lentzea jiangxiensis]SDP93489.1 anti-anti-sigma factor [Lentzea jiangxiensis]
MERIDITTTFDPRHAQVSRCPAEVFVVTTRTAPSGAVVVAVRGEVDMATCMVVRDQITEQLRFTDHLVLDLSEVAFFCAAGITVLVVVGKAAQLTGADLCVVARTRQVRLPLMITGLSGVLDLHLDVGEALECRSAGRQASPAWPRLADPGQPGDLG